MNVKDDSEERNIDEANFQKNRKGQIKINPNKSKIHKEVLVDKQAFEKKAGDAVSNIEIRKEKALEYAKQYIEIFKDKTLLANKGPIQSNLEKETISNLISLGREMNNDQNEQEGAGGIALTVILLKLLLKQRDINNDLEFRLIQIEKQLSKKNV